MSPTTNKGTRVALHHHQRWIQSPEVFSIMKKRSVHWQLLGNSIGITAASRVATGGGAATERRGVRGVCQNVGKTWTNEVSRGVLCWLLSGWVLTVMMLKLINIKGLPGVINVLLHCLCGCMLPFCSWYCIEEIFFLFAVSLFCEWWRYG